MKSKIANIFFILVISLGFVDQIDDNWALVEIQNQNSYKLVAINIKKAPCKVKEGSVVVIKNKKEIIACLK